MFLFELMNLGEGFKKYFAIVPALTDDLRREVYRIRHKVYCEELGWEPRRPDQMERDDHDSHALHCLIRSVSTGDFVGCSRLVLTPAGDPHHPLPFEKSCAATLDRSIVDPRTLPRHTIAEFSRLAVIARYRRRKGEENTAIALSEESFGTSEQPRFPYLLAGLYLGTIELASQHGIDTLFVLTEPRLASHLGRLGVRIQQIGGPVEHRGTRVPSMMSVKSIIAGLNFVVRPLHKVISEEVKQALVPDLQD